MIPSDLTATAPGQKTAIVTPLTVEIAVVRIGHKQMTQSVFKQLPERNFVSMRDGNSLKVNKNFHGDLWGYVKYDPLKKSAKYIIFSDNGVLYKDRYNELDFLFAFDNGSQQVGDGSHYHSFQVNLDFRIREYADDYLMENPNDSELARKDTRYFAYALQQAYEEIIKDSAQLFIAV